jgi:hypothetical protein
LWLWQAGFHVRFVASASAVLLSLAEVGAICLFCFTLSYNVSTATLSRSTSTILTQLACNRESAIRSLHRRFLVATWLNFIVMHLPAFVVSHCQASLGVRQVENAGYDRREYPAPVVK